MGRGLRITAFTQGWYGQRMVMHMRSIRPDWEIWEVDMGKGFPRLLEEDGASFLASELISRIPDGALRPDIALFLLEEAGAALLMPGLADGIGAGSVLCPVDAYEVIPR
ncbi:hypothetical protein DRO32_04720, partial [Candidatus Bathyarchaeota archaeon]